MAEELLSTTEGGAPHLNGHAKVFANKARPMIDQPNARCTQYLNALEASVRFGLFPAKALSMQAATHWQGKRLREGAIMIAL